MYIQFRKYAALFLLALFVFPFVEKGIHDLDHAKDTHCSVKNSTHFHAKEHHCEICDFTVSVSYTPECVHKDYPTINYAPILVYFYNTNIVVAPAFSFSLRGPPLA